MGNLEFIRKLYNGKNCYSDHMSEDDLNKLHIKSGVESVITNLLNNNNKIVFLTGNPGDGKTFIIKAIISNLNNKNIYIQKDLNDIKDYSVIAQDIVELFHENKSALIAVNEYPFIKLCRYIRRISPEVYNEILSVKRKIIVYAISQSLNSRIAIVDLNERNMLCEEPDHLVALINRILEVLNNDELVNSALKYNIDALSNDFVKKQLVKLFQLATSVSSHFSIRDILGAISFLFTACTLEDYKDHKYYSALFEGNNELLNAIKQFDPIYITCPCLDEHLWNGEIKEKWLFGAPEKSPCEIEEVDEALALFSEIKRKYYFENLNAQDLLNLQPEEIIKCKYMFTSFESQKKKIKESIVRAINKLFLPSSDDKKQLHIWTTHRYDMSHESTVAVSSRYVDSGELDIMMPRPADWINGLEYVPDHIIMKHRNSDKPILVLDIDFLRTLSAIDSGYPIELLASQYEQVAAMFLQQLQDANYSEENDDGEIILACRSRNYRKKVHIQDGKYSFEEED